MFKVVVLIFISVLSNACDPHHKKECEWVLVAEKDGLKLMSSKDLEDNWVPVCARNYVVNKQRCNLKIKLNVAKAVQEKAFKLVDMEVDNSGLYPKAIKSIKTCSPSKAIRPEDMKK